VGPKLKVPVFLPTLLARRTDGLGGIHSFPRPSCFSSRIRLISRTRALNFCRCFSFDAISASCFKRSSRSVWVESHSTYGLPAGFSDAGFVGSLTGIKRDICKRFSLRRVRYASTKWWWRERFPRAAPPEELMDKIGEEAHQFRHIPSFGSA